MKNHLEHLQNHLKKKTGLHSSEINHISSCFHFKTLARHEILVDHNSICTSYYFINKGIVRNFTINTDGLETSRYFAFAHMFTTALPSFIDQQPSFEYLQSITKTEILICDRHQYYDLMKTFPELDRLYRRILEKRFITSQKLIYGFQGFSALEKVKWIIKNQPHLLLKVPHKMVASYLGMSPSTLSRVMTKL